ncbi:hypothetical protein [Azohydromonas lata]|uniref:IclR-ED domain-containing protein n=1 Tax=Azohydromonas lata TaxID=45677 RepID=A0ABU5II81_9BURK|nr:hypothetical protein [Azohydromonas lata]MDZ5458707.1 hypothetical protein [Azohydromonas lata]
MHTWPAAGEGKREALLELLRRRDDRLGELARDEPCVWRLVEETLERGYAVNEGESIPQANFAAVAVPVHAGSRLLAAMNLVFAKAAVSSNDLQQRFVPALKRLAHSMGRGSCARVDG